MACTRQDIDQWFEDGINRGSTHMLIVCDTFDYEDYPVFVGAGDDEFIHTRHAIEHYNGPNMQKVMEVYCLHQNKPYQLNEYRAWHPEPASEVEFSQEIM